MKSLFALPCLLLLAACGPRNPQAPDSGEEPETRSVVAPEMEAVAARLDTGGVVFSVTNGHYEWETIQPFFQYIDSMMEMMRMADEDGEIPPQVYDLVDNLPSTLGLDQLAARGASTVQLSENRYRSRSVIQTLPDADGLLWRLQGDPVDFADEIRRLPDTTVFMGRFAMNGPELFRILKSYLLQFPRLASPFTRAEARLQAKGVPLRRLLASLKQGGIVALSFNPEFEWILPGTNGAKIPEVGLMMVLSDVDGAITDWLVRELKAESPLPMVDLKVEGVPVRSIGIPAPVSTAVALQLAQVDGRLLIATSPLLMEKLLQPIDASSEPPLLAALEGIEKTRAIQGWVARPDLGETVQRLTRDIAVNATRGEDAEMVKTMMENHISPVFPMPYAVLSQQDGDMRVTTLLHDRPMNPQLNGATMLTAPALVGMLAAIALPSFQKARTAARENACVNNLRQLDAAKDQWAIEEGKRTGDEVTFDNVSEFLRGVPVCPQGGQYTLNTVGEDPVCTVPGHELP